MKRLTILLTGAAMLLTLPACSTTMDEPMAARSAAAASSDMRPVGAQGPALWKVADEDTTIYMFGTIHILPDGTQWYTPTIASALGEADVMVTEILSSEASGPKMQQQVAAMGMLPAGQTLRGLLDAQQRATYESAMTKLGLPAEAFDQMKPWLAGVTLSVVPLVQQGYNPEAGVEKGLEERAATDLARDALETAEYQFQLFNSLPQEAQIAVLTEAAEEVDNIKSMVDSMVAEWVDGDADGLAALMNEGLNEDDMLAERLLYVRNRNWAEWIDTRLDQPGTVFMAVGAGHLAGEKSVQDYLTERGIAFTRVQ